MKLIKAIKRFLLKTLIFLIMWTIALFFVDVLFYGNKHLGRAVFFSMGILWGGIYNFLDELWRD